LSRDFRQIVYNCDDKSRLDSLLLKRKGDEGENMGNEGVAFPMW